MAFCRMPELVPTCSACVAAGVPMPTRGPLPGFGSPDRVADRDLVRSGPKAGDAVLGVPDPPAADATGLVEASDRPVGEGEPAVVAAGVDLVALDMQGRWGVSPSRPTAMLPPTVTLPPFGCRASVLPLVLTVRSWWAAPPSGPHGDAEAAVACGGDVGGRDLPDDRLGAGGQPWAAQLDAAGGQADQPPVLGGHGGDLRLVVEADPGEHYLVAVGAEVGDRDQPNHGACSSHGVVAARWGPRPRAR